MSGPWRITFDTNPDDCNLSCIMCEDHSPYSNTQKERIKARLPRRRMSIELVRKIILQAKPMGLKEIIPSTMGEPLLYKNFEEILALCHEYQVKLNLTTNGTFPQKGAKAWAQLIVPITSDVKISWNGATKQTHESIMKGIRFDKVLENVKEFIAVRDAFAKNGKNYCRVTFQLTFLEQNVSELESIINLAIDLGVDRVKGHHLWTHFKEIENLSMRKDIQSILCWNNAVKKAQALADKKLLANGNKIILENIYLLESEIIQKKKLDSECPFLGKEAWVATDGRFNPCCAPDKERRELGEFGNLKETSLQEIWESKNYQNLKMHYAKQSVCQKCNMRKKMLLS